MLSLFEKLKNKVTEWKDQGYPCENYPAIAEVLEWSFLSETNSMRYLRQPQLRALETYWYLRLVEDTPHIFSLYNKFFPGNRQIREAFGLTNEKIRDFVEDSGIDALWERIKADDQFVKDFKLEAIRETLTLNYPSYILALAMGAGKTILIGAIYATEFAMTIEYPNGPFVQNALVFAPGKTIIESLRELTQIPYEKIIPPRLFKNFAASLKLTFTRDGEKDIPVIAGSIFNVVVTNTEKIRIQKESIRKSDLHSFLNPQMEDIAKEEVANRRLQAIASLPHLAIFSDEAHHTYGQSMETGLKKVRKTVDYLAQQTNLIAVINTTGTPYYQKQPLKDVVFWYGLSQGISEGYLKDISGNILAYDFSGSSEAYLKEVIKTFFEDYGDVCLLNGSSAKLAIYFPQTEDLKELRPVIDTILTEIGLNPTICLVNTSDYILTKDTDIEAFNRLNDPSSPHRVILLVNKGTEGWNCPSLFACALARKLKSSNNFVLQATTRCLRQVPGNTKRARVYLSLDNFSILDRQLKETYGESIADLNRAGQESRRCKIILRKIDIPPLLVKQVRKVVRKKESSDFAVMLKIPQDTKEDLLQKRTFTISEGNSSFGVLRQLGDTLTVDTEFSTIGLYSAAVELSVRTRMDLWNTYDLLAQVYGNNEILLWHIDRLSAQIEEQTAKYEVTEEKVDFALALVKPEGFNKEKDEDGTEIYTAEILYPKDKEHLIAKFSKWKDQAGRFGFHYDPYNFDSNPEMNFLEEMLREINLRPEEIEDIYFTGAITDPAKTDFFVEYKDCKGKWKRYTPDFVIRKKPDKSKKNRPSKTYIVEIKRENDRSHTEDGENGRKAMALRKWENLNPDHLKYEMIFTSTDSVSADSLKNIRNFIAEDGDTP